jgi:glycosyltransferase involved in cell wall biosynthesis
MLRSLQIIDTLHVGGAERLAINYANGLSQLGVQSHLCATRQEGPLLKVLDEKVEYIFLNKKSTIDFKAFLALRSYILKTKINLIHAHSSSYFIAVIMKLFIPDLKIIWHDHYGNSEFLNKRPKLLLKFCSLFFSYILSVNKDLRQWSAKNLHCKNVIYLKNFPVLKKTTGSSTTLYGENGKRILCLANLREQKNQIRLLESFQQVASKYPDWTLHCVGKNFHDDYSARFFEKLRKLDLNNFVYFYDSKTDIINIMQQCQIGILVSKSEGLPMALLEYGISGLAVICTDVGDCGELIKDNSYGILLEDDKSATISEAIMAFIEDEVYRTGSAHKFHEMILRDYSEKPILTQVVNIYNQVV